MSDDPRAIRRLRWFRVRTRTARMMHNPAQARRWVIAGVAGYAGLSVLCVWLEHVERVPSGVESIAQAVIPYTFFLLGPPVTLTAGRQGLSLFVAETIVLVGLVWLTARLYGRAGEAFAVGLMATVAFGWHAEFYR